MHLQTIQRISNKVSPALSLKSPGGQLTQVRNHVKVHPWRKVRTTRECYLDPSKTPYTDPFNMNEFNVNNKQKKPWQIVIPKDRDNRYNAYKWNESYRSDPAEAKEISMKRFDAFQKSVESRGSAREYQPYSPPENVREKVLTLLKQSILESGDKLDKINNDLKTDDDILAINLNQSRGLKFSLLKNCIENFGHDLPNSYLNDIETVGDVVDYYNTPKRGVNAYTAMIRQQGSGLPENLYLIPEPERFNKESNDAFKGLNALPGIVSKVPGLRASKKYPVLNQDEFEWPDV